MAATNEADTVRHRIGLVRETTTPSRLAITTTEYDLDRHPTLEP